MIDAPRLLRDLQGDLGPLVSDLGAKVKGDEEVRGRLDREWRTAFDAHRTGRSFEDWLEDRLTQVGVAWLLACVFVRFCEDNHLIDEAGIAGPGDRGDAARAAQQRYFTEHPHDSDREYLQWVFRAAAALPSLGGLLADGESPLWLIDPPADACTRLLTRFRTTDDAGRLVHDFSDPAWSTRFLGDLYQDLSQYAKDTYALLQTPDFVEEFILDRTLTPAIETFGLARTTLIDPTCGSGHFLLGAFGRLFDAWREAEPGVEPRVLAQRALTQVTGVDLNPFAAAIARFRLVVAALKASTISRIADAPDFTIDVAVGDSLLWGARPGQLVGMEAAATAANRQFLYRTEHADTLQRIFNRQYAAVAGNPPYIIARDPALNAQYRVRYPDACRGKYSLAAPFMQCFFELAITEDRYLRTAGFAGMITTNAFMKRESGKNLVEKIIPTWDITHVIDTSYAIIPGHTTATAIILGRHRAPTLSVIRTVSGIRSGETVPVDASKGDVWTAIMSQIEIPGSESEFVSVADVDRVRFDSHPWSIGGGGAAELKERLEGSATLRDAVEAIGVTAISGEDEVFIAETNRKFIQQGIEPAAFRPLVIGERLRDWASASLPQAIFPYQNALLDLQVVPGYAKWAWAYRTTLGNRVTFAKETYFEEGRPWWAWHQTTLDRLRTPLSIAFAFVSTHNHFVLDRGGKVFKQTAPVMKLKQGATLNDHLQLIALLNSSTACFWLKQGGVHQSLQQVGHGDRLTEQRRRANAGSTTGCRGACRLPRAWDHPEGSFATGMGPPRCQSWDHLGIPHSRSDTRSTR
ncbi:MAG: BREX-2 system adenine-specific DNA-methyltransferase PglX, partial [Actinomycetota bacterium]|nr:BREX-2 system adenine-specific DNA-methyltransferase PglX [Actinomycetota bacterium]